MESGYELPQKISIHIPMEQGMFSFLLPAKKEVLNILSDVNGIIKPSRLALKTSLLHPTINLSPGTLLFDPVN